MAEKNPIQTYLTVRGGVDAVAWYECAFDAKMTLHQMADDNTRMLHATLAVFGSEIMLSDEFPEFDKTVVAPPSLGATTATVHVNLSSREQVKSVMASAESEGATLTMPPDQMPWGPFYGRLIDPFGHSWSFAAD